MSASAFHVAVASGTGDVQAHTVNNSTTGQVRLMGWSFHESAGSAAAAELIIRDGTSASAPIVAVINLAADQSAGEWYGPDGITITAGVFIDRVSGTSEGAVYLS